jgi:ribosome-associated heat shock protein Hsp15
VRTGGVSSATKPSDAERLRIDRWLWCARFYKTRSVAADAVKGGHVRLNGQRVKPAHDVKPGDLVSLPRGDVDIEVAVLAMPVRRGPAAEAALYYAETDGSLVRRQIAAEKRAAAGALPEPPTRGRPDKRTRRLLRTRRLSGTPDG